MEGTYLCVIVYVCKAGPWFFSSSTSIVAQKITIEFNDKKGIRKGEGLNFIICVLHNSRAKYN